MATETLTNSQIHWMNFITEIKRNKERLEKKIAEECQQEASLNIKNQSFTIRVGDYCHRAEIEYCDGVYATFQLSIYQFSNYNCIEVKKVFSPVTPEYLQVLFTRRYEKYKVL